MSVRNPAAASVDELRLPVRMQTRSFAAFRHLNITTIQQVMDTSDRTFLVAPNCGRVGINAIRQAVLDWLSVHNTPQPARGYYLNSLRAWKSDLQKQLRQQMARHARMEGSFHPDRPDQGKLIDLTKEFIARIDAEIGTAS